MPIILSRTKRTAKQLPEPCLNINQHCPECLDTFLVNTCCTAITHKGLAEYDNKEPNQSFMSPL